MWGLPESCPCRPGDSCAVADCVDRYWTASSPTLESNWSTPGGCAGRTSGSPRTAETLKTRCAKRGAAAQTSGWRSPAAPALPLNRRGRRPSDRADRADLIAKIEEYLAAHNDNPKPFIWTATADDILAKVARGRVALQAVNQ